MTAHASVVKVEIPWWNIVGRMERTHLDLRGRKEPGSVDAKSGVLGICGGMGNLPEASYTFGDSSNKYSLTLVVRLVAIYLDLILIELYSADSYFTGFVVPKLLVNAKIENVFSGS